MGASGLGSRSIIGEFFARLEQYMGASWIDAVSVLFSSDQASETYKWLGQVPAMREWLGGRNAKGFLENGLTIANKKFEATLEVSVDDIRRDKTQQILIRIDELAQRVASHWAALISTLIANGTGSTNGLCYDGQYFFDSDHSEGSSGTQINLLTATQVTELDVATAAAPTAAEAVSAILGVVAYMLNYKDNEGEPMNSEAKSFLVMTSPALWKRLVPAVVNPVVNSGDTNAIVSLRQDGFDIKLAANPRLTYTTQFVTFRTDAPAKALIRQEEVPLEIASKAEGSEFEFDNDAHQYGIKAVRNVGYGYWQYASHATLS